jgi:copper homeostasis protein
MNFKLEVIAFNIESCVLAQKSGAHRIELCDNPGEGGTTPSIGMIKVARAKVDIELFPIIRPRGGDFLYSDDEFNIMKEDILQCKKIGCDGVVIGLLHADGTIDKTRTSQLVNLAYPMSVTFHRAFDRTNDPFIAMEDIIDCGCERILTSGQQPTASEGIELIAALIKQADERIIIMPGSGLRSDNITSIAKQSGAIEFHSSARTTIDSKMSFNNPTMKEQLKTVVLDATEVSKMATLLSSL